jgi:hypothetical protein
MPFTAALLLSENAEVFLITLTMVGSVLLGWKLLGPVVQALARRLEPRAVPNPASASGLANLRVRVQELEAQHGRLLELEDRLDFAERMLAQRRDAARLPAGGEQ